MLAIKMSAGVASEVNLGECKLYVLSIGYFSNEAKIDGHMYTCRIYF